MGLLDLGLLVFDIRRLFPIRVSSEIIGRINARIAPVDEIRIDWKRHFDGAILIKLA